MLLNSSSSSSAMSIVVHFKNTPLKLARRLHTYTPIPKSVYEQLFFVKGFIYLHVNDFLRVDRQLL